MKYFLDTEFIEDGKTIDLISIGIVAEDGRELYLQNGECDFGNASEWVEDNVFPHLVDFDLETYLPKGNAKVWSSRQGIARKLIAFIGDDPQPEFWGYYADYDWVVFCQLFGTMMDLPRGYLQCLRCEARMTRESLRPDWQIDAGPAADCPRCKDVVKVVERGAFPMFCMDIKQLAVMLGNPTLPEQETGEHHALNDARWNKAAYEFLTGR